MHFYTQSEAQALMNRWGAEDRDFLFVIDYAQERCGVWPLEEVAAEEMLFAFPTCRNDREEKIQPLESVAWYPHPEPALVYHDKFDIVQRHLYAGNSFLVNLTCRIPVETTLSLKDIYLHSKALYKLWMRDHLVCFSPEIFVRIADGHIHSYPMKGTISADVLYAEERLMANAKEAAEHATIVDLIRNDLSIVADEVRVSRYRYTDQLHTHKGDILQTSSDIEGRLPADYREHIGDILFAQLPAGSITGAPKKKTVEIIAEAEDYDRGFYTGVMGVCQRGKVDSAVMIRYVEEENGQLYFKAGGGITANSRWEEEYEEVIQKAYVPIY